MRNWIIASVTVFLGFAASEGLACGGGAYGGGHMMGGGHGSGYYSQDYLNETAALRQELAARQGEYNAMIANPNPDPARAAQLSREIVSLQDQLQAGAQVRDYRGSDVYHGHGRY